MLTYVYYRSFQVMYDSLLDYLPIVAIENICPPPHLFIPEMSGLGSKIIEI